jgi:hypothetical protein
MHGQRAQRQSITATKLASSHFALQVQSSQTLYSLAAATTNSNPRLFCRRKSPSQVTRYPLGGLLGRLRPLGNEQAELLKEMDAAAKNKNIGEAEHGCGDPPSGLAGDREWMAGTG